MRSKWLLGLLGLLALLASVYLILALLARPARPHPFFAGAPARPLVIAHQGGDGLWPGESLYAYEQAAALGVDVLEMDIHMTADGALVLMHDSTVDRTTDGSGAIREMALAQLKELDAAYDWSPDDGQAFPYRGQGIQVATLEEIFTAFPGWRMNIEIKQADPPLAEPFCQLIRDRGMQDKVLVASFNADALQAFRQACPEVSTSASESEVRTFFILQTAFLSAAYSPAAEAVQVPEYSGDLHVLTPGFVRAAHGRNLEVHAWTINTTEAMQRMLDLGLDGIITDYPDRLLSLLGR